MKSNNKKKDSISFFDNIEYEWEFRQINEKYPYFLFMLFALLLFLIIYLKFKSIHCTPIICYFEQTSCLNNALLLFFSLPPSSFLRVFN